MTKEQTNELDIIIQGIVAQYDAISEKSLPDLEKRIQDLKGKLKTDTGKSILELEKEVQDLKGKSNTDIGKSILELEKEIQDLKAQKDANTESVQKLKGEIQKLKENKTKEDEVQKLENEIKKIKEDRFWNRIIPTIFWILVAIFMSAMVCCLTCTYKDNVLKYAENSKQYVDMEQQIEKQQNDISKLESNIQSALNKQSGFFSVSIVNGQPSTIPTERHSSPPSDPHIQTLFSLAYLCTLFVVALVVTVLVPLRRILRKHDDYY